MARALAAGLALGLAMGVVQLWWLRVGIRRSLGLAPQRAALRVAGGAVLRQLLWLPILAVTVRLGLPACLALLAGLLASHWACWLGLRAGGGRITPRT